MFINKKPCVFCLVDRGEVHYFMIQHLSSPAWPARIKTQNKVLFTLASVTQIGSSFLSLRISGLSDSS